MDEGPPPLTKDTQCGVGFIRSSLLQKFANKKAYVFIYGLTGLIFSSSYAYFNGTITAMEKRFKIPSRTTGFITTGSDMSQLLTVVLSYYAGKGHRPRWIAMGVYTVVLYCLMNALPHFMYGAGEEALSLTQERQNSSNMTSAYSDRVCNKEEGSKCIEGGDFAPQIILFTAQFISGIGGSLYYTLGVTYMDDNIKKSKTPALVSLSYFIRMLGPAIGYGLATLCLKIYISPFHKPVITDKDPRWLGAWWLGWIVVGSALFIFSTLLGLFPKVLPRAAQRKMMEKKNQSEDDDSHKHDMPSWDDLIKTIKKLLKNKTFMCNTLSSVFYFLGYMPYWIFMPKYIEMNYKVSPAYSSLITGVFGLVFSAMGVLISGVVITKSKPRARALAMWNVFVGASSVIIILAYAFMGCGDDTQNKVVGLNLNESCRADCNCEFTKYAPVCGNNVTYISACHAGCTEEVNIAKKTTFQNCACIPNLETNSTSGGWASQGACPVDCKAALTIFIAAMCVTKFIGATGRTSNFLVSVRCVDEKDKSAAMGLGVLFMSAFAFIPSPILFGHLIDTTCTVWGQTCSGKGNCWLYDSERLRNVISFTSAVFVTIGTILDYGVWYYVKNLSIFDEPVGEEMKDMKKPNDDEPEETDKLTEENTTEMNNTKLISNGI